MNDEKKIRNTAKNYMQGWYEARGDRMEKALHPKLMKRRFVSKEEIWSVSTSDMIELTNGGRGKLEDPKSGKIIVTILDIFNKIASVKIHSEKFVDYLHMVKEDNSWKIVDVLWDFLS